MLCEWIASDFFRITAANMAKEMRYDLYTHYFRKCTKVQENIDADACKKYFDFNQLCHDIDTLVSKTAEFTPKKARAFLIISASLGMMFYYSWQLTLAILGGFFVAGVFYLLTLRCQVNV